MPASFAFVSPDGWAGVPDTPLQVQWAMLRKALRKRPMTEESAATLLTECGILRFERANKCVTKDWAASDIGNPLLAYLVGLQEAVRALAEHGGDAIKQARQNDARRVSALAKLHGQSRPKGPTLTDEERRRYMRENPSVGRGANVADIFGHAADKRGPMESKPGYSPLRSVDAPDAPSIATRLLLNLEGVGLTFTLDADAYPVARFVPSTPLATLLMMEYSDAVLTGMKPCINPRCRKPFRGRARTCSKACEDYLKKVRNRKIDEAMAAWRALGAVGRKGMIEAEWVAEDARARAAKLAGGPVEITVEDVQRRKRTA